MKTLTKKSKIWIIVSCLFFAVVAGLTTMLILLLNKDINYDGLYIPLSQVDNLGYAQTDNSSFLIACSEKPEEFQRGMSFSTSNKTDKNDYEKVKFKDKNGDKEIEQTLHLESFNQTERFVFLDFSEYYYKEINTNVLHGEYKYIVDKQSGEIYNLDDISENIHLTGTSIRSCDWGDSIVIYTSEYSPENPLGYTDIFYILSIENGQLKIEELFNNNAFKDGSNSSIIMTDKYHNCIIENQRSGESTFYIMDKNRKISQLNINQRLLYPISNNYGYFYKTPLGEIYCSTENKTYVLNENGTFVETKPISFIDYETENLFYVDESTNSEYYYERSHTVKITYLDENNYTIETIYYSATPSSDKIVNLFLYGFTKDTISKINAIDGTFQVYNISYKEEPIYIYKIEVFDMTSIKFYAQDSYLNQISGVIDSNGVIEFSFEEKEYKIMYIPPIRKKK